ncbi:NACHT domain-containing protein [Hymenobacter sp. BT507]|uniref:NACHT domain-containing protein n=1 Tax=Hymenobacter citatus TaxID=2763506 RepID=A0ABR7MMJ8_9BACT|nr:NACHT domain-containing protein [Hymenobacter citatus]MBC6611965.1 NACHT domain-containing protein [Hymenobacter citatus]
MDPLTVAILAEPAKQIVKPVYDKFLEPQLGKIKEWFKEKDLVSQEETFEEKCLDYINQTYDKCNVVNTLVFPNEQIKIDDLYQPLRLVPVGDGEMHVIANTQLGFLKTYRKVLVRDQAGMGKSTLMKWIVCKTILNNIGVPVFIELRKLSASNKIIDEIFSQFNQIQKPFNKDLLLRLISNGHFIIILDGYDEIVPSEQNKVVEDIVEFSSKARNNYFIMTSRPESSLSTFGDFKVFNIAGLKKSDYISIINKCDAISGFGLSENLISDLDKKRGQVQVFLKNPFLVTLLYKAYAYNKNIPLKKSAFYEEIYQALYKHHDLSKDRYERPKKSGLDIYQFRQVLRRFAFQTAKDGIVEYTIPQLTSYVEKARKNLVGIPSFSDSSFVEDIIQHVPLFSKEGLDVKWLHKSLQDYFAAEYIVFANQKDEILNNIYNSGKYFKYENILDFIVEIDYPVFRNTMLYNALIKYNEFYDKNKGLYSRFSEDEIDARISMIFGAECYLTDDVRDDELSEKLNLMIINDSIMDYSYGYNKELCIALGYNDVARLVLNYVKYSNCENIFINKYIHPSKSTVDEDTDFIYKKINNKIVHIIPSSRQFYNTSSYFSKINNVYVQIMGPETTVISYEKCKLVKLDIERRKVGGADNDDLTGL